MYDFVVVGVGPAGARLARRAAEAGYDVLALEKGTVGTPLACSGHVSTDIWAYVPESAKATLLQNRVYGANFRLGGPDSRAYPFYKSSEVSNVIDRVELDRTLADAARAAGTDVREGHTVTAVDERADGVRVTASADGETHTFEGRLVAGCDGPVSRVRREIGLPEPAETLHGVLAFDEEPDHGDFVDVHLTVPRFFAWRIPRGDAGVEYGLAAPPGTDVTERFERLTDAYGAETTHRCSGAIPIGPPERVTSDRAFLVGDAAAQTKPFTGGGILYGMTAADHAVDTIDPTDPSTLDAYERAWRSDLRREIRLGHLIRRAYSLPEPIQRLGLWALDGEIGVHMDRPTSFFSVEHLRALVGGGSADTAGENERPRSQSE
ncbi:geranylgeranyl reductase family protein [Haloplanus aerogenes]|uniref:Geranylgeranyl reductase family protein n=1 Tax=Haloplanus aerogenes TaxID=660522 RepID=A0A3M0CXZ6_9EURY|nr:geranylgeranyl reductase family protein [Haloplanus aerogenes]AZH26888.1 geranylgeranyl reductase family protein [Haloplanus aerogenes]RMB12539.1 geranylgeranyl reductase family protein [Haloplanus aerogenes]